MAAPVLLVEFTTDDPDDTTPSWTDVTDDVRSFSTNRGRDTELARVEAGTATVVLNNRSRSYDPTDDATLQPMNRWRISAVMDGPVTEPIFLGYVESYEQQWPAYGKDAVTVVSLVDEFKVLALDKLPTTDPPRDTYHDLVLFDEPFGYWAMDEDASGLLGTPGDTLQMINSAGRITGLGAILGQTPSIHASQITNGHWKSSTLAGPAGDAGHGTEFTAEGWFATDGTPGGTEQLMLGPFSTDALSTWSIGMNTSRQFIGTARNSSGTQFVVTSTTAATSSGSPYVWYHVVVTITGGFLRIYVNGVQEDTEAWSGVFEAIGGGQQMTVGNNGVSIGGSQERHFDELAFYRTGMTADRVLAHYTAGTARGFARGQDPGDRMEDVLDAAGSVAPRDIQTGTRAMVGSYMIGQPPLDELRKAEAADSVDSVLFIARDGTITFLADGYRSSSPYDAVAATFDDDGTDLPYQDITVDYSDSFLFNEWNVTRTNGTTTTESDATSISSYFKRSQSLTDLPILSSTDQDDIAAALLAKYKDPLNRITSLSLLATEEIAETVLPLDLGYRIRVFRTQPGGGRIDQTLFIQRIAVTGSPGAPWQITLGVSPL